MGVMPLSFMPQPFSCIQRGTDRDGKTREEHGNPLGSERHFTTEKNSANVLQFIGMVSQKLAKSLFHVD